MRSLMISTSHTNFSGDKIEKNEMGGACTTYAESRGVYRDLVGKHDGKNYLEDPGVDGRIILKWIFRNWGAVAWTGSMWLRVGTDGGHL